MNLSDFRKPSGRFVTTPYGVQAFVPNPLHPPIDLAAVALPLGEAMQAIGELRGACRRLPSPDLLVRPLQRQEALTSSAMEGTFTTDDNLLLAEIGDSGARDDDTKEVANYLTALNEALEMLKTLPICHRVLTRTHEILLGGLSLGRGAQKRPGEYKTDQNWIGGATIARARFVPAPPREAAVCMDALEAYLNRPALDFPTALMDLALVHYQLETIHPFADGNGRVGRMLISLMAVDRQLLEVPVLYLSPTMERYKDEYIDLMYNVSANSAWNEWFQFFFARVSECCRETVDTIDRLLTLQANFREQARQAGRSGSLITLVDELFAHTAMTANSAADRLGVTYAAANTALARLVKLGILVPLANSYPRVFYSPAVLRAARRTSRIGEP